MTDYKLDNFILFLTLFIPKNVTKLAIYNADTRTSNIHNNTISCVLLDVSAELRNLQGVYTPIFKTQYSTIYHNIVKYYIAVTNEAELRKRKI